MCFVRPLLPPPPATFSSIFGLQSLLCLSEMKSRFDCPLKLCLKMCWGNALNKERTHHLQNVALGHLHHKGHSAQAGSYARIHLSGQEPPLDAHHPLMAGAP